VAEEITVADEVMSEVDHDRAQQLFSGIV